MLDNLWFTVNALLPIIILIALGYFLKRINFLTKEFASGLNKIVFRVFLPILLFANVYDIDSISNIDWKIVIYAVCAILATVILGFIVAKIFISENKQRSVIHQATFRSNYAIIGIPLATMLAGGDSQAVATASVISAIGIPIFNICAVIALSMYDKTEENKTDYKKILINICKNPLIIGVLLGIVVLGIRYLFTLGGIGFTIENNIPFIYTSIKWAAAVASPLALVALGGQFTFSAIARLKKQIIVGVVSRSILVPVICLTVAYFLDFGADDFPALIALFGTPVAVSSVPMAAEMGQDDELAGQIVVWTSILSAVTLFIIIFIAKSLGVL